MYAQPSSQPHTCVMLLHSSISTVFSSLPNFLYLTLCPHLFPSSPSLSFSSLSSPFSPLSSTNSSNSSSLLLFSFISFYFIFFSFFFQRGLLAQFRRESLLTAAKIQAIEEKRRATGNTRYCNKSMKFTEQR